MLTKQQAQSLKKIREVIDVELPIIKKRLEIVETGHHRVVDEMMLSNMRRKALFNIDNADIISLLHEIDIKLLEILENLKEIKDDAR